MHSDERGHAMTTGSAQAAAALDGAIHNFLHWKAAVMPGRSIVKTLSTVVWSM